MKEPFKLSPLPIDFIPGMKSWGTTAGRYQFVISQDDLCGWSASYKDMQHEDAKVQRIRNDSSGDYFPGMAEALEACRKTYATLPRSQRHELTRLFGSAQPEYSAREKVLSASSIETSICEMCDNLHLTFQDPNNVVFADGTISVSQVDDLVQRLQQFKQTIIMRNRTEGLRN